MNVNKEHQSKRKCSDNNEENINTKKHKTKDDNEEEKYVEVEFEQRQLTVIRHSLSRVVKPEYLEHIDSYVQREVQAMALGSRFVEFHTASLLINDKIDSMKHLGLPLDADKIMNKKEYWITVFRSGTQQTISWKCVEETLCISRIKFLCLLEQNKNMLSTPLDQLEVGKGSLNVSIIPDQWETVIESLSEVAKEKRFIAIRRIELNKFKKLKHPSNNKELLKEFSQAEDDILDEEEAIQQVKRNNINVILEKYSHSPEGKLATNLLYDGYYLSQVQLYDIDVWVSSFIRYQWHGMLSHHCLYIQAKYNMTRSDAKKESEFILSAASLDKNSTPQFTIENNDDVSYKNDNETNLDGDGVEDTIEDINQKKMLGYEEQCTEVSILSTQLKSNTISNCMKLHFEMSEVIRHVNSCVLSLQQPDNVNKKKIQIFFRSFNMVPFSKFSRRFIRVDNTIAKYMANFIGNPNYKQVVVQDMLCSHMNKRKTRNLVEKYNIITKQDKQRGIIKTITGWTTSTIVTDGVQAHLCMERIVKIKRKMEIERVKELKIGQDKRTQKKLEETGKEDCSKRIRKPNVLKTSGLWRSKTLSLMDKQASSGGLFSTKNIAATTGIELVTVADASPDIVYDKDTMTQWVTDLMQTKQCFKRLISIDPGKNNIISAVIWDTKLQDWIPYMEISSAHFYDTIGRKRHRQRMLSMKKHITTGQEAERCQNYMSKLAHNGSSSILSGISSEEACLVNLLAATLCFKTLFTFYGSKNMARDRFNQENKKQHLVDTIIEHLIPFEQKDEGVIIVGSGGVKLSNGIQSGTSTPSPVHWLINEIARKRCVIMVPEQMTTVMSPCCLDIPATEPATVHLTKPAHSKLAKHNKALWHAKMPSWQREEGDRKFIPKKTKTEISAVCVEKQQKAETGLSISPRSKKKKILGFVQTQKDIDTKNMTQKNLVFKRYPATDPGCIKMCKRHIKRNPENPKIPSSIIIHGLVQCQHCERKWSRDAASASNIGWAFVGIACTGTRPTYLRYKKKTSFVVETTTNISRD